VFTIAHFYKKELRKSPFWNSLRAQPYEAAECLPLVAEKFMNREGAASFIGKSLHDYRGATAVPLLLRFLSFSFAMIGEIGVASTAGSHKQPGQPRLLRDSN